MNTNLIEKAYLIASERYAECGVDVEKAVAGLEKYPISMHCWQGDDVGGFEKSSQGASGGILSTGNYLGKARSADELRGDMSFAFSLIPGPKRANLHAIYAEPANGVTNRDELSFADFTNWAQWAKNEKIGVDFNPTFFSHPLASSNLTLSNPDCGIRDFWIRHAKCCRKIASEFGRFLGTPSVDNIWAPDGFKDIPVDRAAARHHLRTSLDAIFEDKYEKSLLLDAVESKLFGIGVESCTVGSHEFYLGYALKNDIMICLDSGHFHPTEAISDKISSCLEFMDEILLHVSRPVRWDSDHVVLLDDELAAIAQETIRANAPSRVHLALDYFDGTINRIAAWVTGTRNLEKALLRALLEPTERLKKLEAEGDFTSRLMLLELQKVMPWSAVWDYYCIKRGVPTDMELPQAIKKYESEVLSTRI